MPYHKLKNRPDIQKRIKDLRMLNLGYRAISNKILEEFGINVSHTTVQNELERNMFYTQQIVSQNQELAEQVEQDILDTTGQLRKVNEKMWKLIHKLEDRVDNEDDVRNEYALGLMLSRIIAQLKISDELLGAFKPTPKNVSMTVNIVDMSVKIVQELKRLERLGYIKILKSIT